MKTPKFLTRLFGRGAAMSAAQAVAAIANRPMLMAPGALETMIATAQSMPERTGYRDDDDWTPHGSRPEHLVTKVGKVGVVTIQGPLFQRWSMEVWWWGGTAYDMILAAHLLLLADAAVDEIFWLFDTPGGTVAGCFDTVDALRATRGTKRITSISNDSCYSAGYALASAADRILVSRTAGAGSIGVVATHVDISKWNERVGVTYESVISGEKKVDYSPHAPMSERARTELQAEIDRLAQIFFETVAANRGLDVEAIRAMQAGCFFGPLAVAAGLADEIGTLDSALVVADADRQGDDDSPGEDNDKPKKDAGGMPAAAPDAAGDSPAAGGTGAPPPDATVDTTPKDVMTVLGASKLPSDLIAALVKAKVEPDQIEARVSHAREVASLCAAAHLESCASSYVERNVSIEAVRAELLAAVEDDPKTQVITIPPSVSTESAKAGDLSPTSIYQQRRAAGATL